jgi:hypothetical protein
MTTSSKMELMTPQMVTNERGVGACNSYQILYLRVQYGGVGLLSNSHLLLMFELMYNILWLES